MLHVSNKLEVKNASANNVMKAEDNLFHFRNKWIK